MSQATDGHSTASAVSPATSRRSPLGAGAAPLMTADAAMPSAASQGRRSPDDIKQLFLTGIREGSPELDKFFQALSRSGPEIADAWLAVTRGRARLTSQPNQAEDQAYVAAAKSIGLTPVSKHRLKSFSIAALNALMKRRRLPSP